MLNNVSLMGRLVAAPVIQTISKQEREITIARYRLAIERDYKEKEHRPVDFIVCKAFGTDALYAQKYFDKGDTVIVNGRIFSEKYKKEGSEKEEFFTGVLVRNSYLARKTGEGWNRTRTMSPQQDGVKNEVEEELPPLPEEYQELPPLPEEEYFQSIGMML